MSIDASIYGQQQPVKINTPFENLSQILQIRNQQENARGLAEQRQALADQRRQQTDKLAQENADRAATGQAIQQGGGVREQTLAWARDKAPNTVPALTAFFDTSDEKANTIRQAKLKIASDEADFLGDIADGALKHGGTMEAAQTGLNYAVEQFPDYADGAQKIQAHLATVGPDQVKAFLEHVRDASPSRRVKPVAPSSTVSPGQGVLNPTTGAYDVPIPKEPTKPPSAQEYEYRNALPPDQRAAYDKYQNEDANRKRQSVSLNLSGMNALYSATDPKAIAAGIRSGEMPPDISQYGRPVQGAVASELTKPGPNGERFNLADAQRTWTAQKRLNSTMNGSQQVRIDQSIKSGLAMYDKVDALADEWKGKGLGPLSRANLTAATNGAMGPKAADIAIRLQGQIAQLTSDVATLEQGGMTPTNEARDVAKKSMEAWWGNGTIHSMTAQGRANMKIRDLARQDQGAFVGGNTGGNVITGTTPKVEEWVRDANGNLVKKGGG